MRRLKNILTFLSAFVFALSVNEGVLAQPLEPQWSQRYNGERWEEYPKILQRADGGYALCYTTTSYSVGDMQIRLVLTDSLGNIENSHSFGGPENEELRDIVQTSDGGLLLSGATGSYGACGPDNWAGWLFKTDSNGDSLWSKVFSACNWVFCQSVVQTPDGIFCLVKDFGMGDSHHYLCHLGFDGDSLNSLTIQNYYEADTLYNLFPVSIHSLNDGEIAIYGTTLMEWSEGESFRDEEAIWVRKLSSQLDILWTQVYHHPTNINMVGSIHVTANSDLFLIASQGILFTYDADAVLIRLDSSGNRIWTRTYGDEWLDEPRCSMVLPDGAILIAGRIGHGEWTTKNWLMKVSVDGDSLWSYEFGDADRYDHAHIAPTSDGGCIFASTRQEYSGEEWDWLWDIEVFKFGPEGLGAGEQPSSFVIKDIDLRAYPNPFNPSTTISFDLPTTGPVSLVAYDLMGRVVQTLLDQSLTAGKHTLTFDAASLPSGSYFIQLQNANRQRTQKIVLLR